MKLEDKIIIDNLDEFNDSIRDEFVRKRINDTGAASKSIHTVQNGSVFQSVGSDYIEVLDKGRGAGTFAPVSAIQDWVKSKLGITDEPTLKSVAYAVNLKIKNEGTGIYKDNSKGLEIDEKITTMRKKLTEDLRVFAIADIKRQLNKFQSQRI